MKFIAGNAQHIGARQEQQDSFGFSDPDSKAFVTHGGFLGVVADGMGGLTHGHDASSTAVRSFLQAYQQKTPQEPIPDALARSLREANRAVLQVAGNDSANGVGTTLAAAVVHDDEVFWISAGDSRVYWLQKTHLTRLTADHIYAAKLDREMAQGKISRAEAQNHPERASLTSYLGQPEPELVDRNRQPLTVQPDDCIILCSDGLYRALTEAEIAGTFRHDLQRACDSLVQQTLAKQRKKQDNITVIALKSGARARSAFAPRAPLAVLIAIVAFLAAGGAGYWYAKHIAALKKMPPPVQQPQPKQPAVIVNAPITIHQEPAAPTQQTTQTEPKKQPLSPAPHKRTKEKGSSKQSAKGNKGQPTGTGPSGAAAPQPKQEGPTPAPQQPTAQPSGGSAEATPPSQQGAAATNPSSTQTTDQTKEQPGQKNPPPNPESQQKPSKPDTSSSPNPPSPAPPNSDSPKQNPTKAPDSTPPNASPPKPNLTARESGRVPLPLVDASLSQEPARLYERKGSDQWSHS